MLLIPYEILLKTVSHILDVWYLASSCIYVHIHTGLPGNVETDGHEIIVVKEWEQLVQDNSGEGYYYDDINSVLWLRLVKHETAKIMLTK